MYATARHAKKKVKFHCITNADILSFLAMYYYMELVWCPARKDYWRQDPHNWLLHPPAQEISMNQFYFIWRHIHLDAVTEVDNIDESILEVDDGAVIPEAEQYVVVETVDNNTPEVDDDRRNRAE